MLYLEDCAQAFAQYLKQQAYPTIKVETLYEPANYFLNLGGKRIRPLLSLLSYQLFKPYNDEVLPCAYAVELFHNFSLVHDDIMDKATLRRGQTTVHLRNGEATAILVGDLLCIDAYNYLLKYEPTLAVQLMARYNKVAIEVCEGQQMDMDFEQLKEVDIDTYLSMIEKKTSVLLGLSFWMGAKVAGAIDEDCELLYKLGLYTGIAFQLKDDYLDAFGDAATFGKTIGGDIKCNKKTYLLLKAMEMGTETQRQQISETMLLPEEGRVAPMLALYTDTGAKEACESLMANYTEQAYGVLNLLSVSADKKEPIIKLLKQLLDRVN